MQLHAPARSAPASAVTAVTVASASAAQIMVFVPISPKLRAGRESVTYGALGRIGAMELRELLAGADVAEIVGDPATEIDALAYDSRRARPGTLFFCRPRARKRRP